MPTSDTDAARDRVDALFATIDRLTVDDLGRLSLPARTPEREAALTDAREVAERAGRGDLLREAVDTAREGLARRFGAAMLSPTFADLNWGRSLGTADDRVHLADAVEEAVVADVVAGLVPHETTDTLTWAFERIADLAPEAGHAPDESLGNALTSPSRPVRSVALGLVALVLAPVVIGLSVAFGNVGLVIGVVIAAVVLRLADRSRFVNGRDTEPRDPPAS